MGHSLRWNPERLKALREKNRCGKCKLMFDNPSAKGQHEKSCTGMVGGRRLRAVTNV